MQISEHLAKMALILGFLKPRIIVSKVFLEGGGVYIVHHFFIQSPALGSHFFRVNR